MNPQNTYLLRVLRRPALIQLAAGVAVIAMVSMLGLSHGKAADLQPQIDPLAKQLIDDDQAVGFVVGIFAEGREHIFAYGESEKGSGKLPDSKTLYEIGSSTKPFTALLLADAIQAGQMKLEDPVQKFLPKQVTMPEFETQPITLEGLATHTSGLPRLPDNMKFADPTNPYADYTVDQMYAFLNGHKLPRAAGTYEYSNLGMGLLGHVLARQAKKPYEQLVVDQICTPLKMNDTRITLNENQLQRLALGYNAALQPEKNWDLPTLAGAGALRSTVDDMLKFVQANLANDETPLSKAMQLSHEKRHTMPDGLAIALGWHIAKDQQTIWHNGMTGGYSSWVSFVPSHNVGVIILSNTATQQIATLGEQITRIACGDKVVAVPSRKEIDVDRTTLDSYTGSYAIVPQFVLNVTVEDGKLMVQATGQPKIPVFAESKTKFFYKIVNAHITFVPDEKGAISKLILHQNGRDMEAARTK
jgi:CubicO group peptidase (beta-lactamase class C family)